MTAPADLTTPAAGPAGRRPRAALPFRLVAVHTALVFAQAALAGNLLAGNARALRLHEVNGTEVLTLVGLIQLLLAVLVWWPGRGPAWPALVSLLLLGAEIVQIGYGFAGRLAVHVPLGVAVFGLSLTLLLATRGLGTRR